MKTLKLISKDEKHRAMYRLKKIKAITYHLARDIYNESDIGGNDLKEDETVMIIYFDDGHTATFSVNNWIMYFE